VSRPAAERSRPPGPGASRGFRFPAFERERLSSGLELILAPRRELPTVELLLLFPRAGGDRSPADRPGLAALAAALLDEGSRRRSGLELATELESIGATLATGADWDSAFLELDLLAADLDLGLERAAEIVREPAFPDEEIDRLRALWIADLRRRADQPARLADDLFSATLYDGTPYRSRLRGTEAALSSVRREELESFHGSGFAADRGVLLVGGDFQPGPLRERARRLFADWVPVRDAPWPRIDPPRPEASRILVLDRPQAAQTELRIGHVGVARTDPDRDRLGVLNAVLGGKFTSRLNLNLRERHGFTYGVSSRFVDRRGPGPFLISAAIDNDSVGAAVRECRGELARICQEPVSEPELAETRSYLLGVFPYTLQTTSGLLGRLSDLAVHGFPDEHYDRMLEEIRSVDAAALLDLARAHLRPDACLTVAAGPALKLVPQLESVGEVEVRKIGELEEG